MYVLDPLFLKTASKTESAEKRPYILTAHFHGSPSPHWDGAEEPSDGFGVTLPPIDQVAGGMLQVWYPQPFHLFGNTPHFRRQLLLQFSV
jgi:hypothetical protein